LNKNKEEPNESEEELLSLRDIYDAWKIHYANRSQWLYRLHMVVLTIWIAVRYGIPLLIGQILKPAITYFKELGAGQNGSIRYRKHRS